MKILYVSRYVEPNPVGANANVFRQAKYLVDHFENLELGVLTWPVGDLWTGPIPPISTQPDILTVEREGITYHVFSAPDSYDIPAGGAELSEYDWEQAVEYGMQLLSMLKPEIVHLQHRHGLWWILESAQRLGISTIYSNHDWGIPCMRTVLVMGDNQLCDSIVEPKKCAACIGSGRSSLLGQINERLVRSKVGELLANTANKLPILGRSFRRRGLVIQKAEMRTLIHHQRATRVIKRLSHLFTPSHFGATFFSKFGCPQDRISVLPWYHDTVDRSKEKLRIDQPFTITYIGRVSPEKGIDYIFSALEALNDCEPVSLRIAGANGATYCRGLKEKYPVSVGIHAVEWLGWSKVEPLFQTSDVTIIPSQWIDNTPLSLIESLAYRTPVIATRVPPIEELLLEGETGFMADFGSVNSLTDAVRRAVSQKSKIRSGSICFPEISRLDEYMGKVVGIYSIIAAERNRNEY
jgi:glycosyltransferase involved in cell wall biosynthesis